MNLNQVTVPSINISDSIRFYEKLGLKLIVKDEHYARFECPDGDATFSVHLCEDRSVSNIVVYFEVENLSKTVKALKAKRMHFETQPTKEAWLWEEARLRDPSDNLICIYHAGNNRKNPPWKI